MAGYMRRRGDAWRMAVELERDPTTGKRRQHWTTFKGPKKAAEAHLAALVLAADTDAIGNAGDMTVAQLAARWLAHREPPALGATTHANYACLVRNQIVPVLGSVRLAKLRASHVLDFEARLRDMPKQGRVEGTLSTVRQHQAFTLLKRMLKDAVRWRLIAASPAVELTAPTKVVGEMRPYTAQQAAKFMAAAHVQGLAWHAFFVLALSTGMRLSELVGLRWLDVDVDGRTVRVAQTMAYVAEPEVDGKRRWSWVVKPPKTKSGRRVMPIDPDLAALLRRHKAEQNAIRLRAEDWDDRDLVFPSSLGTPVQSYIVRKVMTRICAVAGLPVHRFHDIRHTCATLMLTSGVNVKVVAERLGHANVGITLGTYSHVLPGMQEDAAVRLASVLRGGG